MNLGLHHVFLGSASSVLKRSLLATSLGIILLPVSVLAGGPSEPASFAAEVGSPRIFTNRNGVLTTKDGLTLRLKTDLGSVRIVHLAPDASPVVQYAIRIETDARAPLAQRLLEHYVLKTSSTASGVEISGNLPPEVLREHLNAQFWVQFEIAIPAGFNVDVNTESGDIETQDIGGTASLITQAGNIRAGSIGVNGIRNASVGRFVAKLQTEGGHIQVQDVSGDLSAFTAGGHIVAGNISGDATLRTGGGHIRAGQIGGRVELDTDGGNITVGQAGKFVNVRTGGGQIDFGEVRGSVRAQTGGGGIRILYVTGPMEVESSGGSICLTHVAGTVKAATGGGTITAWINPDASDSGGKVHLAGASQLASGNGDIIVFLPRNLAATIDAVVTAGGEHRIEADPALNLTVQTVQTSGVASVRATGALNGGGASLKLRSTAGKIRLQFLDSETGLRESLMREQQERIEGRLTEISDKLTQKTVIPAPPLPPDPSAQTDWLEGWIDKLEVAFTGGLHEDPSDFQKRLVYSPHPSYPDLAKRAGVQGIVTLQVRVTKDGRVEVLKVIGGEPVLADAAISTVKQWRAKPVWSNGKPMEVISTVIFNFKL